VKEGKEINLGVADSTTAAEDFKYSMRGKVISITYLGPGSISQEIGSSTITVRTRSLADFIWKALPPFFGPFGCQDRRPTNAD